VGSQALALLIEKNPTLRELTLDDTHALDVASLREHPDASLLLSEKGYGNPEAILIASLLKNSSSVTRLDLSKNSISVHGAESLGRLLEANHRLQSLTLACNPLGPDGTTLFAAILLKRPNGLTELDLSHCGIGSEGAKALASLLKKFGKLCRLELAGNRLLNDDVEVIARALQVIRLFCASLTFCHFSCFLLDNCSVIISVSPLPSRATHLLPAWD